jgi:hypothetical protein
LKIEDSKGGVLRRRASVSAYRRGIEAANFRAGCLNVRVTMRSDRNATKEAKKTAKWRKIYCVLSRFVAFYRFFGGWGEGVKNDRSKIQCHPKKARWDRIRSDSLGFARLAAICNAVRTYSTIIFCFCHERKGCQKRWDYKARQPLPVRFGRCYYDAT